MSSLRLVCPGCGAQYDVPLAVIPPDGRDVQCASCGQTWFQPHPDREAQPKGASQSAEAPAPGASSPDDTAEPSLQDNIDSQPEIRDSRPDPADAWDDVADATEYDDPDDALPEDEADAVRAVQPVRPRSIDPAMATLFQEEREHEAQQRRAQADPMESQPDLGLQQPPLARYDRRPARPEAPGQARESGQALSAARARDPGGFDGPGTQSRRDRLPNIDDVNESLRDDTERRLASYSRPAPEDFDLDEPEGRSGFGLGFVLPLVLAGLAVGAYAGAPAITEQVPEAAPLLDRYADAVDAGRIWLAGQADALRALIETF